MTASSPVAMFVYNRPSHALASLEALARNRGFEHCSVHVFSDGPRTAADAASVRAVRSGIRRLDFENVVVVERRLNLGLSQSIKRGIADVLESSDRVIVLEDDLLTHPGFLEFMNAALERYRNAPKVRAINGFMYPRAFPSADRALILPYMSSWSWATWRDSWLDQPLSLKQAHNVLRQRRSLRREADIGGVYPYYLALNRSLRGPRDEFALLWALNIFLSGGVSVWPSASLVRNIGFDGSGDHSRHLRPRVVGEMSTQWTGSEVEFPSILTPDPEEVRAFRQAVARFHPRWYPLVAAASELALR